MRYDAIIIGAGQAGPPLAVSMAGNGKKVALIEKDHLGGTCVNTGCTPTKAYVASARRAFVAKNSKDHGINIGGSIEIDLKQIKARKDTLVAASRESWDRALTETEDIDLIRGKANFIDPHTIAVNGNHITGEHIFINVGGRPFIPEGFEQVDHLTNRSILELEEIPEHLVIVGGGYAGLEFGQMFRRFGSRVTILERGDRLMKQEDEDISEAIAEIFNKEGITVRLKAECINAVNSDKGIEARVNCEEGEPKVNGSHLLIATGRIPNTDDLRLEKAGVETDDKGYIRVDNQLRTNVGHIYALGDCNGEGAFTHTAYNDFQVVNSRFFTKNKKLLSDRIPCYAAFVDPALARVGMNEASIRKKGLKAMVATWPLSKIARAKEMGETEGVLKIYVDENSKEILGASFLGAGADEYIHSILDAMYAKVTYGVIKNAVHIHPTISELIPTMLGDLKPLEDSKKEEE